MTKVQETKQVDLETDPVNDLIMKIEKVLEGERRDYAIAATLSLAVFLQNPSLPSDKLMDIVEETLKFMCLKLLQEDMERSQTEATKGAIETPTGIILTDLDTDLKVN